MGKRNLSSVQKNPKGFTQLFAPQGGRAQLPAHVGAELGDCSSTQCMEGGERVTAQGKPQPCAQGQHYKE